MIIKKPISLLAILLLFTNCRNTTHDYLNDIQGKWKVESLSNNPLWLSNFKDSEIDSSATILFNNLAMEITFDDTLRESKLYQFNIRENELGIWYSDYGLRYRIKEVSDSKLVLESTTETKWIVLRKAQ